jgi:hypothetical protein
MPAIKSQFSRLNLKIMKQQGGTPNLMLPRLLEMICLNFNQLMIAEFVPPLYLALISKFYNNSARP